MGNLIKAFISTFMTLDSDRAAVLTLSVYRCEAWEDIYIYETLTPMTARIIKQGYQSNLKWAKRPVVSKASNVKKDNVLQIVCINKMAWPFKDS